MVTYLLSRYFAAKDWFGLVGRRGGKEKSSRDGRSRDRRGTRDEAVSGERAAELATERRVVVLLAVGRSKGGASRRVVAWEGWRGLGSGARSRGRMGKGKRGESRVAQSGTAGASKQTVTYSTRFVRASPRYPIPVPLSTREADERPSTCLRPGFCGGGGVSLSFVGFLFGFWETRTGFRR